MTDVLITGLATATTLAGANVLEVQQTSSFTAQTTLNNIADFSLTRIDNSVVGSALAGPEKLAGFSSGVKTFTATQLNAFNESARLGWASAPYFSGHWYNLSRGSVFAAGAAVTANTIRMYPIIIDKALTVAQLGLRITTGAAGNVQMAVYAHSNATNRPTGNALITTASQSTGATGTFSMAPVAGNTVLNPGVYWCAINVSVGTIVFSAPSAASSSVSNIVGASNLAALSSGPGGATNILSFSQTFGTWPDLTGQSFSEFAGQGYAHIFFQAA